MPALAPVRTRVAIATLALAALAGMLVVLVAHSDFMDLSVYRWAGDTAFDRGDLYLQREPHYALKFAYTPFAAVVFAGMDRVGLLLPAVFSVVSGLALVRCCMLVATRASGLLPNLSRRWVALLLLAVALLLEPTMETLRLGQINFLLAWLLLEDVLAPRTRRWAGVLVGLAAAIKLTPGIFIVLLVLTGRVRAAVVACATGLVTILLGWLLLPTETRTFFAGTGTDAGRFGGIEFVGNQSPHGAALRLFGADAATVAWLVPAALAAGACLWLARTWWPISPVVAIGLTGIAGLFVSPLSWTHHWVIALPLLVGLWQYRGMRVVIGACVIVFASRIVWRVPHGHGAEFHHTLVQSLAAESYLLVGTALVAAAWLARPSGAVSASSGSGRGAGVRTSS